MQLPVQERIQRYWEICVTPEFMQTRADFLQRIIELGMATPTPMETFGQQFGAAQAFDSYDRLPAIQAPTLILHGDRDILIPPDNAQILRERITGAQVRIVQGTGHCFFWEAPEEVVEEVASFLSAVPAPA
jgi:pimeloyl-ACP methyl ester carboxylesterase